MCLFKEFPQWPGQRSSVFAFSLLHTILHLPVAATHMYTHIVTCTHIDMHTLVHTHHSLSLPPYPQLCPWVKDEPHIFWRAFPIFSIPPFFLSALFLPVKYRLRTPTVNTRVTLILWLLLLQIPGQFLHVNPKGRLELGRSKKWWNVVPVKRCSLLEPNPSDPFLSPQRVVCTAGLKWYPHPAMIHCVKGCEVSPQKWPYCYYCSCVNHGYHLLYLLNVVNIPLTGLLARNQ